MKTWENKDFTKFALEVLSLTDDLFYVVQAFYTLDPSSKTYKRLLKSTSSRLGISKDHLANYLER